MSLWWLCYQRVSGVITISMLFDFRVFSSPSSTSISQSLMSWYRTNEEIKKNKYNQRIREVEHFCFSPLIFSTSGGFRPVSTLFIKRLALLHSTKFQCSYSTTVNFFCRHFFFSILNSALRCLCGPMDYSP